MHLSGRHAFVTGGGTGIGAAIARVLHEDGARLTLAGHDEAPLRETAATMERASWCVMDVSDEAAVEREMTAAEVMSGAIDILVANAGIAETAPLHRETLDQWRRIHSVNVEGVFLTMRHVIDGMAGRGWGRIIATASMAGLRGYPYLGAYSASKHAVVGLVKCASLEVMGKGVTVNAICPGYTHTQITEDNVAKMNARSGLDRDDALNVMASQNPFGRLMGVEEIASAARWLCGPGSDATNGQTISIHGGPA